MRLWLFAVGLATLLGQVVLLRELLVAFFGSELVYLLAIGLLMLGTALGAWAGRWFPRVTGAQVRALLLLFAAFVPGLLALARALRVLLSATPGAYPPFSQQLAGMALVCLPLGVLGGLLFHRAARVLVDRGGTLAAAYAVESVGGMAGGALSTLFLASGVSNLSAGLACGMASVLAALFPLGRERARWLWPCALPLLVLLASGLSVGGRLDRALSALNHPALLAVADTPYARVAIAGTGGQVVVFVNDALAYESQGTSAEEFVHVSALQVARPRSVLLLGGAVEGLAGEVLKHGVERAADLELDRRMVELVLPKLPEGSRASLADPRVRLLFGDPRRDMGSSGSYDLILSAMPEPESGQANRYYTREFFESCRRSLRPGGVLAFRLRSAENLWTPALVRRTASIHAALKGAFKDVLVLPGTTNLVLASDAALTRDPDLLIRRFVERRIEARLVSPPYLRYLVTNDRVAQIRRILSEAEAQVNTDARPVCYPFTLLLWLSRFDPRFGLAELPSGKSVALALAVCAAAGLVVLLVSRRSWAARRIVLVLAAGFAGMLLEGALLLAYQTSRGILYQDLGLLITLFMGGLAIGSKAVDGASRWRPLGAPAGHGAALVAGTFVLSVFSAWAFSEGVPGGIWLVAPLLFLSGFATGGLFAFASLRRSPDQPRSVAPLYSADLLGGGIGALCGSLLFLPLLGLPATALLVAGLALLLLIVV